MTIDVSLRIRGRPPLKMYIRVFVCFASKAVHLELVCDLSTSAFIMSFKRFAARRGKPKAVHCDYTTNFVRASRVLNELQCAFYKSRQSRGQRTAHPRRFGNNACRSREGAQQPSNCSAVFRSQRRRSINTSSSNPRKGSAFAAAKIRRRRKSHRDEAMQAYVLGLQGKSKWHREAHNIKVGQVVIVHEISSTAAKLKTSRPSTAQLF